MIRNPFTVLFDAETREWLLAAHVDAQMLGAQLADDAIAANQALTPEALASVARQHASLFYTHITHSNIALLRATYCEDFANSYRARLRERGVAFLPLARGEPTDDQESARHIP